MASRFCVYLPSAWCHASLRDDSIPQQIADSIQGFALISYTPTAWLKCGGAHFGHFRSVAGFEPAKCIFWYRFPTEANPWTDSNRHTLSEAFRKTIPFKIYLQSHRCKGILDRFELPHYSACRNQGESEKDAFSVRIDSNYHIDSKAMQNGNTK